MGFFTFVFFFIRDSLEWRLEFYLIEIIHFQSSFYSCTVSLSYKMFFFSALHMASIGQHAAAVRILLELGLRDSEDASGTSARQLARKQDVIKVFQSGSTDLS